jgi:hypothetical protein
MDDPSEHEPLDLPERPSAEASWMACDAYLTIISAHPDDQPYIIAQYLDAFAKRYGTSPQSVNNSK